MKNKKIGKSILYNSIGSFVYLFCQWIITFIIVWIAGYKTAGIFSIAMSVSTTFSIVSTFNMRNFQSSDTKGIYSEKTYLLSRVFTCILSFFIMLIYSLIKSFDTFQFCCIVIYMIFKLSEAFVDVLHGALQRKWRFDIIGISYFIRGIISVLSFSISLYFSKNLLIALSTMTISVYTFILIYDFRMYKIEFQKIGTTKKILIFQLLLQCLPLVIYGFLLNYYSMIPRVVANETYGSKILGFYASVATPALIIQVAASFIFNPLISLFAEFYHNKDYKKIISLMIKVIICVLLIGIIGIIGSYFFADFILLLLFGSKILPYTYLFYGVIIVSTLTALIWFLAMILTVSRSYFALLLGVIIPLIITSIFTKKALSILNLNGINAILIIAYLIQIIIYVVAIVRLRNKISYNENSIIYVRSTSIVNDSRASKEILSLVNNGYSVKVLGWDRDFRISNYKDVRINNTKIEAIFFKFKAGYGQSKKNIIGLFLFQFWIIFKLIKDSCKYKVIHACDFDCGFASFIVCLLLNKKLVYDMYDYYSDSRPMSKRVTKAINNLENTIINYADVSIICGGWRRKQISGTKPKELVVIHNTPDIRTIEDYHIIKSNSKKIKIGYIGILQDHRLIMEILNEICKNNKYELHIGGFGEFEKSIIDISKKHDNIYFYGSLKYSDVLSLESDCDILFATYDPKIKNHKYSAPNKVYEAMALGKVIIVCNNTGIDSLVKENNFGYAIDYDAKNFINVLDKISRRDIINKSKNSKKLYVEKYNWIEMEKRLICIYKKIIGGNNDNSINPNLQ